MLKAIGDKLSKLRSRLARETSAHDTLAMLDRPGRTWSITTAEEMSQLQAERYRLRADRNYWADLTLKLKLETLRSAVAAEPRDIGRINLALRSLLQKVVIDWENARLVLHWRHREQTLLNFHRQRQRGGERNPTPGLSPRRDASSPSAPVMRLPS